MGACEAHLAKACPEVCVRFEHRPQIQLSSRTYTLPMLHHDDTPLSAMLWRSPEGATDSAETEQAMLQEVSWGSRSLTLLEHRSRRLGGFDIAEESQVSELFGKRPAEGSGGLCASGGRKVLHAEFRKCCDRQSTPHPSQFVRQQCGARVRVVQRLPPTPFASRAPTDQRHGKRLLTASAWRPPTALSPGRRCRRPCQPAW
mmetsp:Transcript_92119/g.259686  ORF Transcript_92119/g.259686 Transcript_92119/m.259686 type:complete len:201 (+) Transcript_92119:58-660(+)